MLSRGKEGKAAEEMIGTRLREASLGHRIDLRERDGPLMAEADERSRLNGQSHQF